MAYIVQIKPRALREIERAAQWWAENRPAALGAVRKDIEAALALLVEESGIGIGMRGAGPCAMTGRKAQTAIISNSIIPCPTNPKSPPS